MDQQATAGRELARLIHLLQEKKVSALREHISRVDWAFVHYREAAPVVKALAHIPAALARDKDVAERFAQYMELLPTLDENAFDDLAWEYRDERAALKLHQAR